MRVESVPAHYKMWHIAKLVGNVVADPDPAYLHACWPGWHYRARCPLTWGTLLQRLTNTWDNTEQLNVS
eukprot:417145-Amphidinium_carterae.1